MKFGPVQQDWVLEIPLMQQSVLFAAVRAPDGLPKNHFVKVLIRWYRRCVLLSAFERAVIPDPFTLGGGSFTGAFKPSHARRFFYTSDTESAWNAVRQKYLEYVDEIPHHFQLHFMHAAQIVGTHHPDPAIATWWYDFYLMIVDDAHLQPESKEAMNLRLSDNSKEWIKREVRTAD